MPSRDWQEPVAYSCEQQCACRQPSLKQSNLNEWDQTSNLLKIIQMQCSLALPKLLCRIDTQCLHRADVLPLVQSLLSHKSPSVCIFWTHLYLYWSVSDQSFTFWLGKMVSLCVIEVMDASVVLLMFFFFFFSGGNLGWKKLKKECYKTSNRLLHSAMWILNSDNYRPHTGRPLSTYINKT